MDDSSKVMDLAYEAGSILLENGAEISRVEETMQRIAGHFGVEDESVFVLSNGIMATSKGYARSKFIPIKGTSLDKVVAVNQLSREVAQGRCGLPELERRLKEKGIVNILAGAAYCEDEDEYLTHDSFLYHSRMGYTKAAYLKGIGKKFGRWYDLLWMQKKIG